MTRSTPNIAGQTNRGRERIMLLAAALAVALLLAGFQWRAAAARAATHGGLTGRLERMQADADRILALRDTPRSALSRTRPSEELLSQVEKALAAAGIDRAAWRDSVPAPAVVVPGSDYRRMTTRLYFEQVTLRQLAGFAEALEGADPTLTVAGLNLRAREETRNAFDVDLGVGYLLYTPKAK